MLLLRFAFFNNMLLLRFVLLILSFVQWDLSFVELKDDPMVMAVQSVGYSKITTSKYFSISKLLYSSAIVYKILLYKVNYFNVRNALGQLFENVLSL